MCRINERYFKAINTGDLADQYGMITATPEMIEIMKERDSISMELIRDETPRPAARLAATKVSRNAPCPCGSGRKYKRCHGI